MKTLKTILALVLVVCLFCTLFAACAKTEAPSSTDASSTNIPATDNNKKDETPVKTDESADPDEIEDVIFWVFDDRGSGVDNQDRIEAAMNKITEPKGIHVKITYLSFGDYSTKVQLSISGGEQIDVLGLLLNSSIANMRTNGMVRTDITDIYKTYAADALEEVAPYMGPYMDAEGTIYGLPTQRAHVGSSLLMFNGEIADELGLTDKVHNLKSYSELEEVLQVVKDAYPDWYAIAPNQNYGLLTQTYGGDLFSESVLSDNLGDSTGMVYANPNGNVELLPATKHYLDSVTLAADWFNKGYAWPDGLYDSNDANSNMKAKVAFCMPNSSEGSVASVEATKTALYEYKTYINFVYTNMLTTSSVNFWGISVPVTCEEPEAACKFINLLYSDADLMNVFVHGEEGVDYEVEDGQAVHLENSYAEGNYVVGNNLLTLPVIGAGADYWDMVRNINESAEVSPFMGFQIDTSELQLVISQITAVKDQYHQTIVNGGYTEELYQDYLSKLEAAEVQTYLDAVQSQLDAWRAANQ